ncbi:MAG TPA: alpha-2-macroglobulin family protein, partial [Chitinophagaceae bacterium]
GYGVSFFFVKDNRFYQFNDIIQVPWTNKDLDIEFATFRDKTLPGSEEKWTIKLKGYKNEKAAAEMLASMYDASLDQFRKHQWNKPGIWPVYARLFNWNGMQNFASVQSYQTWTGGIDYKQFDKTYDRLIFENFYGHRYALEESLQGRVDGVTVTAAPPMDARGQKTERAKVDMNAQAGNVAVSTDTASLEETQGIPPSQVQIRTNFNETAFFFPELRTDKDGNITFSFTTPEALTTWKLQTFAHTKDLAMGIAQKQLITQKELMVQPNAPRFLRQGDRIEFSAKIVNLSSKEFTGQAELQLIDATTNQPVDGWFLNSFPNQYFTVAAGASEVVKFPMEVPHLFTGALTWRIIARSGNLSDGEENTLPVLSNRLLVTETLPMPVRGNQTKAFNFEKLLRSDSSETLQHHALTIEYTSNPAWYAVQALPYLMEQPNESAEQIWNRYYANSLATKIVNAAPRIKAIFEQWKTLDTAALLSNLQKNQELKSALLEETPWVLQAKTEEQQKKNIALLFDMVRMSSELQSAFTKIKELQSSNGGFVWVKGAPDDRYMTQYIVTGIGHLKKLNAVIAGQEDEIASILRTAIPYLDRKMKEDYDKLV